MRKMMLCSPPSEKAFARIKYPAIAQIKEDGLRVNLVREVYRTTLFTRNGHELTQLPTLIEGLSKLPIGVYDGELLFGVLDRQTSNGLGRKAQRDGKITPEEEAMARIVLWDRITLEEYKLSISTYPYFERLRELEMIVQDIPSAKIELVRTWHHVDNFEQAYELFRLALVNGLEGIILKNNQSLWECKRSLEQVKLKNSLTCELRVIDMKEGIGKNAGMMGALHCVSEDAFVDVWVGTGFSDIQRINWWRTELTPTPIVEIKYNSLIRSKSKTSASLFLPVYVNRRFDKQTATLKCEFLGEIL